ncbi:class E sortase [Streptomyces xinghaiensis]|uniref:class E sortase n=1 Tax=Streptomyces xinghaiensis TaxID=1038928 RepID=UPI001EDE8129|nr:class E sortase [Streptomyces xinghaiensis]
MTALRPERDSSRAPYEGGGTPPYDEPVSFPADGGPGDPLSGPLPGSPRHARPGGGGTVPGYGETHAAAAHSGRYDDPYAPPAARPHEEFPAEAYPRSPAFRAVADPLAPPADPVRSGYGSAPAEPYGGAQAPRTHRRGPSPFTAGLAAVSGAPEAPAAPDPAVPPGPAAAPGDDRTVTLRAPEPPADEATVALRIADIPATDTGAGGADPAAGVPATGGRAARRKAAQSGGRRHGSGRRARRPGTAAAGGAAATAAAATAPGGSGAAAAPCSRVEARRLARARKDSPGVIASRVLGETFITVGVLMLLFVTYQLWWTNVLANQQAGGAASNLQEEWDKGGGEKTENRDPGVFSPGEGFAIMYIPKLDVKVPIAEGIDKHKVLDRGMAGHYAEGKLKTAMPWDEKGNFAVAGHRNTHGEPFRYINKLKPGDEIIVETRDTYYIYAMASILPQTPPSNISVIDPVPKQSGFTGPGRYVTLTTCTPEFTSTYRMIVWGKMVDERPRSEGKPDALVG